MSGHRTFSFEAHDDANHSYSVAPASPAGGFTYSHLAPPYNPRHLFAPKQSNNNTIRPPPEEPQQRSASTAWDHPPPSPDPVQPESPGIEHQPTVIRRSLPPAAAAAAAAALQAVQEDLTPTAERRFWGPEIGGVGETRYSRVPAEPAFPQATYTNSTTTPVSQAAPLLTQSKGVLVDPVLGQYTDNPYKRMSTTFDPALRQTGFDGAHDILSDDEEDFSRGGRTRGIPVVGALRGGAGGGESSGLMSGAAAGAGAGAEKSAWLRDSEASKRRSRWIIGLVALLVLLGIAGGVAAGVIVSNKKHSGSSSSSGLTASEDAAKNGDLNKDSAEIKALMDNPDLHKVFHGMDYTPLNAVYPECLTVPPTQNNITRDLAVLSLLTDKIRLYGMDCNQTEMVLHAIDALAINMTVWIGVWLDNNSTTNTRQLNHLYSLLSEDTHHDNIAGVAVGNEVLFAESLTEAELFDIIDGVRTNLTNLGYDIPVGTSDLGSNWNAAMAAKVDVLMANVHPFFAGVEVAQAANWTYTFFEENDVSLTANLTTKPRVMISEVGWPSGGGSDEGSVAGIDEMNTFMSDFVCWQNSLGTEYFWYVNVLC
jgi:exo-beta-1,3-glucanase (GH17 family)